MLQTHVSLLQTTVLPLDTGVVTQREEETGRENRRDRVLKNTIREIQITKNK